MEALTQRTHSSREDFDTRVLHTRELLGLQQSFKIVQAENCEHANAYVRDTLTAKHCYGTAVLGVNFSQTTNIANVQQALDDLQKNTGATERPCVLCVEQGVVPVTLCKIQPDWRGFRRETFFVSLAGQGLINSSSSTGLRVEHSHRVTIYGASFTLCGIIYL